MQGLYWLASYPRSGNTWLRLMLDSYQRGGGAVDINALSWASQMSGLMYSRSFADDVLGVSTGDLTPAEVLALRPTVLRAVCGRAAGPVALKTHDMRLRLPGGDWLLPADVTLGGVCLVRDPRDVALSLARLLDCPVERAIAVMAEPGHRRGASVRRQGGQLVTLLGSWSEHVASWLDPHPFAVAVIRYEDMRRDPATALGTLLPHLGYPVDPGRVAAAVAETALETLRRQEAENGFSENLSRNRFFGAGAVGGWRSGLTAVQADRICRDHGAVMRRLGYLDGP
ncbi:sulfotransferase domain-containing protein [Novispirillum itersonii]|uniref:Aryl sulfotransferase n=1 Tax=Novispirillum itersonii TaxID=189 RepID=A0A7X0DPA1_NOVIT|nr:sulfotransferase domain-containing protein [Novispirillum itersonii]MBB6211037.1 aryl sulfotransferase [Novispirillum itersonii]